MHAGVDTAVESSILEYWRIRNGRVVIGVHAGEEWTVGEDAMLINSHEYPFVAFRANEPLLRYMGFQKFEDLVTTSELYFRRADQFFHPLPESLSDPEIRGFDSRDLAFYENLLESDFDREMAEHYRETSNRRTFLNGWHMNGETTDRLWKFFGEGPESVAVHTTAGRLLQSLDYRVTASPMRYVDIEDSFGPYSQYNFHFHKDRGYSFEKEFRLVSDPSSGPLDLQPLPPRDPKGFYRRLPVELSLMISEVTVGPYATEEIREKVEDLVEEYLPGVRIN